VNSVPPHAGLPVAPRAFGILVGLFILPLAALIGLGGYMFLASPSADHPYLGLLLGSASVITVVWLFSVSWRLILNRPRRAGGLFSPLGLRAVGTVLVAAPFFAVLSGTLFKDRPVRWWGAVQAVIYLFAGVRLFQLASARSRFPRDGDEGSLP
jgi:hypothetical protein